MLDIFNGNAFSVMSLTEAINNIPFIPGRIGALIPWNESGVTTLTVAIEQKSDVLTLINPSPRGSPGDTISKQRRNMRYLGIPHYQRDDAIMADEVQGVRAFGSETQVQTVQGMVDARMAEHVQLGFDPTLEYQRLGAIKGIILNADGSTLYNLFTEFGVTPISDIDFAFNDPDPEMGELRRKTAQAARAVARALGGLPYDHIHALCGDGFYDELIMQREVRETYLNQQEAAQLRGGIGKPFSQFNFGEIVFENYRGGIGTEEATPFIDSNECQMFPVGVPGLFKTIYAPADYIETVNTPGLPRYVKQFRMPNDKGINMELQMNALSYCNRPRVLVKGIAHSI